MIELVVGTAVMSICLLAIAMLVRSGTRYLQLTIAKTELQRNALFCTGRIFHEFGETNDGSIASGTSTAPTNWVVFGSPRIPETGEVDYDNMGRLVWHKMVGYYLSNDTAGDGAPCVMRSVKVLATPVPYPPNAPPLASFLPQAGESRVIARNVTRFECYKAAGNLVVSLRLDLSEGYGRKYGFEVKTEVYARN